MILDLLRPKERFLVLEIAPERTSGLLIAVDREKNIYAEKYWEDFSFKKLMSPIGLIGRIKRISSVNLIGCLSNIIVSAHPTYTTTIVAPISLKRENEAASRPISLPELENLFLRTLGKIFNDYRGEASKRLGVPGLEVVLVGVRADSFKIDGHLVLNPLGFHGAVVEAIFDLTFTTRAIFEDFGEFFKAREGFFFTNLPRAALFTLSRSEPPPINLVLVRSGESFYFSLEKVAWGHSIRERKIHWSLKRIFEILRNALGTSPKVTLAIYAKYISNQLSGRFSHSLRKTLASEKNALLAEIRDMHPRGIVYVDSLAPLPFEFPLRFGSAVLDEVPLEKILKRFGFRLAERKWDLGQSETFSKLAPFFEFYFDKGNSEINRRLRRRLHWLIR